MGIPERWCGAKEGMIGPCGVGSVVIIGERCAHGVASHRRLHCRSKCVCRALWLQKFVRILFKSRIGCFPCRSSDLTAQDSARDPYAKKQVVSSKLACRTVYIQGPGGEHALSMPEEDLVSLSNILHLYRGVGTSHLWHGRRYRRCRVTAPAVRALHCTSSIHILRQSSFHRLDCSRHGR